MFFTGYPIFLSSFGTRNTGSPREEKEEKEEEEEEEEEEEPSSSSPGHKSANTLNSPDQNFQKKTKNHSLKHNFAEKPFTDVSKGRSGRFFERSSCNDTALHW